MRTWKIGEICEHGSLGRKCEICQRDDEIKELRALLEEAIPYVEESETFNKPSCRTLSKRIKAILA